MKRIETVALANFRGIREGRIDGLVDVNIVVGRNNSGKSTVMEALLVAGHAIGGGNPDPIGRSRAHLFAEQRGEPSSNPHRFFRGASGADLVITPNDSGPFTVRVEAAATSPSQVAQASATARACCFLPSDARNSRFEGTLWPGVLAERRDKTLSRALSDIFGMDVEGVQLPPDGRAILLFADHGLPLDSQGDGARAAFRALTLLGALKDAPLILEEPECYQHPGSLQRFALALVKLARTNGVQLFITTHSSECVAAFLAAAKEATSEAAVFHLALTDGALDARKLDASTVETLTETGTDVRFLSLYA